MEITRQEIDQAGKHRYWVKVSEGNELMLKYEEETNEDIIFSDAQRQIDIAEAQEIERLSNIPDDEELDDYYEE